MNDTPRSLDQRKPIPLDPGDATTSRLFYVTQQRGTKVRILTGPFDSHDRAAEFVEPAREAMEQLDRWSYFDGFGVTSGVPKPGRQAPVGSLNAILGFDPQRDQGGHDA